MSGSPWASTGDAWWRGEPGQPHRRPAGPPDPHPADPHPADPHQVAAAEAQHNDPALNDPGHDHAGHDHAGHTDAGHDESEYTEPEHIEPEHIEPEHIGAHQAEPQQTRDHHADAGSDSDTDGDRDTHEDDSDTGSGDSGGGDSGGGDSGGSDSGGGDSGGGEPFGRAAPAPAVPDVVLLPERRTRQPAADHSGQPARAVFAGAGRVAVPAPSGAPQDDPFWLPGRGQPAGDREPTKWPVPQMRTAHGWTLPPAVPGTRGGRAAVPRPPRRPALGLPALVVLALIAAFFGWVSAEPLWLAVGHSERGTATVARCTGAGVSQRCVGQFAAASGAFTVDDIALRGVDDARQPGTAVDARMVGPHSRQAYVNGSGAVLHLRWVIGVLLVLLCGFGIVLATGARRLADPRARRFAVLASMGAPVLLLAGFLVASY